MSIQDDIRHANRAKFVEFPSDRIVTVEEALIEAGCNWDVTEQTVAFSTVPFDDKDPAAEHCWTITPKSKAIVRQDTGAILGMVGAGYGVLQNRIAFDFMKPWVDSGRARILRAGYTGLGERVVIEAVALDANGEVQRVPIDGDGSDLIENRIISYNSHDGGSSVTSGIAPYRIICVNGMMVLVRDYMAVIKMRHTGTLEKRVKRFQEFLIQSGDNFDRLMDTYRTMADRRMTPEEFTLYAHQVLNWTPEKAAESKLDEPRAMPTLRELFFFGKGQDLPTARNTLFGAYNAFTEWVTHSRGSDEKRYESSNWGAGAKVRNDAFTTALKLVNV